MRPRARISTPAFAALLVGGIALLALGSAGVCSPAMLLHGWLAALLLLLGPTLGAVMLLALHELTGGAWGMVLRRSAAASARRLGWLLIPALLPVLIGVARLYPWAQPGAADDPLLVHRAPWLSWEPVLLRAGLYLLVWVAGGLLLGRGRPGARSGLASAVGILFVLTIGLACVDWVVALERSFYTSVLGLDLVVMSGLGGLATFVLLLPLVEPAPTPSVRRDLGNLLLAMQALHVYLQFSQFLIVYSGDQPQEIAWYLTRTTRGWSTLAWVVVLGHYALPLACLLPRAVKRHQARLGAVCALILVGHLVEAWWWVLPAAGPPSPALFLGGLAAALVLGGAWALGLVLARDLPPDLAFDRPLTERGATHG